MGKRRIETFGDLISAEEKYKDLHNQLLDTTIDLADRLNRDVTYSGPLAAVKIEAFNKRNEQLRVRIGDLVNEIHALRATPIGEVSNG